MIAPATNVTEGAGEWEGKGFRGLDADSRHRSMPGPHPPMFFVKI
jgi:hypothetical protein